MRLYELVSSEGDEFVFWPVHIAYFESRELAERYAAMRREQTGAIYKIYEIGRADRMARRQLRDWQRRKEPTA